MTSWPAHMVSSEIWLSLAKLVHCNEGAGGNRGAWGTFAPPPDFGRIRSKSYSVKRPFITDCTPRFLDLPPALNDVSWNVTVRRLSVSLCVLYCVFTLQARP